MDCICCIPLLIAQLSHQPSDKQGFTIIFSGNVPVSSLCCIGSDLVVIGRDNGELIFYNTRAKKTDSTIILDNKNGVAYLHVVKEPKMLIACSLYKVAVINLKDKRILSTIDLERDTILDVSHDGRRGFYVTGGRGVTVHPIFGGKSAKNTSLFSY